MRRRDDPFARFFGSVIAGFAQAALERQSGRPRSPFDARPGAHARYVSEVPRPQPPAPFTLHLGLVVAAMVFAAVLVAGVVAGYAAKHAAEARERAVALTGGDPDLGRVLARRYGCAGCHVIPGVPGATGSVGPSLAGFASRHYVGGVILNHPDNLVAWLVDPRAIDPQTAMPASGIGSQEARHVAAYLYTLR
jgi:cytochrome c2